MLESMNHLPHPCHHLSRSGRAEARPSPGGRPGEGRASARPHGGAEGAGRPLSQTVIFYSSRPPHRRRVCRTFPPRGRPSDKLPLHKHLRASFLRPLRVCRRRPAARLPPAFGFPTKTPRRERRPARRGRRRGRRGEWGATGFRFRRRRRRLLRWRFRWVCRWGGSGSRLAGSGPPESWRRPCCRVRCPSIRARRCPCLP